MTEAVRLTLESEACPYCGADLLAGLIPEAERHLFGGLTHFRRLVVHQSSRDTIDWICCPDCGRKDPA